MEVVVPALLGPLLKNLTAKLFSVMGKKYNLSKDIQGDVRFLKDELATIASVIDEQLCGRMDGVLLLSLDALRQLAHDTEDCIDHIKYHYSWGQQSMFIRSGKRPKSLSQSGEEMKRLRNLLEEALKRTERYSALPQSPPPLPEPECPADWIVQNDLVGMEESRAVLLEQLEKGPEKLQVISIVGFRGLGKTALAWDLYNDSKVSDRFEVKAWVSARQMNGSEILMEIFQQVFGSALPSLHVRYLRYDLVNYLTNKRYAILNFDNYVLLRVLDLEGCSDLKNSHLKKVCNLLLLQYLSLGGQVTQLPNEIRKLQHLQTLDLRGTEVKILQKEVIQLPNLVHLFGNFKLKYETIRNSEPQKILPSGKSKLQTLAGFFVDHNGGFAELMVNMKELRKVKIRCESSASITDLINLQKALNNFIRDVMDSGSNDPRSLSIHFDKCSEDMLSGLKAPCYLRSLKLHGKLPQLPKFVTQLRGLTELCLSSCTTMAADLLADLFLLNDLKYLKLIAREVDKFIFTKDNTMKKLVGLCIELKHPTFPAFEKGVFPFLESLQLICKDLDELSGIQVKRFEFLREITLHYEVTRGTRDKWIGADRNRYESARVSRFSRE